ncbi:hypothetical protein CDV36_009009 [Fusarium kuroshium]|uniref:Uncharacterized protein n=2 Tax=Fusarium solani species complex TaxID=232080 RepID=A0A3M2S1D7_9HYPO|nr:hypothetical protein CDV36_009009 [Fusarium kuroshium]RSL88254.1 hypothetical protein CEP51_001814 [Fusarium floridanum]
MPLSAESPLHNESAELLEVYQNDGLYAMLRRYSRLPGALRVASKQLQFIRSSINVDRTAASFEAQHKHQWVMARMTAAIPARGLQAILSGTVAYESTKNNNHHMGWYEPEGPGIYVVGLAVAGRGGKFLSRNELEDLRADIRRYLNGYDAIIKNDPTRQADINFVRTIDRILGAFPGGRISRFLDKAPEQQRMVVLEQRLGLRCNAQLDPIGDVIQIQSPQYVGCSDKLQSRTKEYLVKNPTGVNKPIVFLMSLLRGRGLVARPVVRVAMLAFEEGMLPRAERLITVLASSYICQDGLNATEAGGRGGTAAPGIISEAEKVVFSRRKHMINNLNDAISDMDERVKFLQELGQCSDRLDTMDMKLEELEMSSFTMKLSQSEVIGMLKSRLEKLDEEFKERYKRHRLLMKLEDLHRVFVPEKVLMEAERIVKEKENSKASKAVTDGIAAAKIDGAEGALSQDVAEYDPPSLHE